MKEELLRFYNELDDNQKKLLDNDINNTNFDFYKKLYEDSKTDEIISTNRISPLESYYKKSMTTEEIDKYNNIGERVIKEGKVCAILLAGGMGSRLGFKGPKGTFELDTTPKKSLFEIMIDKLKDIYNKYNVYLKIFIMTSKSNNDSTIDFFEQHNYFNYPKDKIIFFTQNELCILDEEGNLVLENKYTIKKESNGNGDIFKSFKDNNLNSYLDDIDWISVFGIDNIILDIIDPLFIGLSIYNNTLIASKSISKPITDKDWVFARVDNKPTIIKSTYLSDEMKNSNKYNQTNILSHLFSKDAFIKLEETILPYHRVYRKNRFLDKHGNIINPDKPNSFKFEKLIFDAFYHFDDMTLLEVEKEDEFSPIKDKESINEAINLYNKKLAK
ncbi:MAG: UTP--glucose-1-phosphate uridylyltransferase [Bacilli bacterium]|nr:UTP--glucose-1-phosphate uridylyltransferase [Bacilli bacterium]